MAFVKYSVFTCPLFTHQSQVINNKKSTLHWFKYPQHNSRCLWWSSTVVCKCIAGYVLHLPSIISWAQNGETLQIQKICHIHSLVLSSENIARGPSSKSDNFHQSQYNPQKMHLPSCVQPNETNNILDRQQPTQVNRLRHRDLNK